MKKRSTSNIYYSDFFSKKYLIFYSTVIIVIVGIFTVANMLINTALKSHVEYTQDATTAHLKKKLDSLGAHKVEFKTTDEKNLKGLAFYRSGARWTMVVCHGYHCSKETGWRLVKMFPECNILLFDMRGHGQSSSSVISFGWHEHNDVLAALHFAHTHKKFRQLPVVGIGFSMGGAALLNAIAHGGSCKALIIDSTFESFDEQVKRIFRKKTGWPLFPFYYAANILFYRAIGCFMHSINTKVWASQINAPTMVIHSKNDDFVAHSAASQLFNALKGPKYCWSPDDAPHALALKIYEKEYKERISVFVEKYI